MKQYLILIRPYGMLFLGSIPVFSAMANGEFGFLNLYLLLFIGVLTHIFSFVQNDYFDISVDKKSKYVSNRPMVRGDVTKKGALAIFTSSFIFSLLLTIFFFFSVNTIITLVIAFSLFTLYNRYSKQYFAMEYILCIGILFFGLFGAYTASDKISNLAIIVSTIGFMQWLFSVGISANLKDVEYDTKIGIKTTPTMFGVHVSEEKLMMPPSFIIYAFLIKILHIIIIFLPFILGYTSLFVFDLPIPVVLLILLVIILFFLTIKILTPKYGQRDKMLVYEGLQEGLSILLIPTMLMSLLFEKIGVISTVLIFVILIIWPLIWLRVLFGKKMIPLE